MKLLTCCLLGLLCANWNLASARGEEIGLDEFFRVIQAGNVADMMKMMHPQLAERIDPPILEAWLQAVSFRLGHVELISPVTSLISENRRELTAEVFFNKGTAEAELILENNVVVAFEVKSEHLTNWFQRPTSLDLYHSQGRLFLQSLTNSDWESCRKALHEKVSRELTDQYLQDSLATIETRTGVQPEIHYRQARLVIQPDERLRQIDLVYELTGSRGSLTMEVMVRFHGMQGHLVGFRFLE